jgi:hypothetical protein
MPFPDRNYQNGFGVVNAYRAVGGFENLSVSGETCMTSYQGSQSLSAELMGDGPFTYQWGTGETTRSIAVYPGTPGATTYYQVTVRDLVRE